MRWFLASSVVTLENERFYNSLSVLEMDGWKENYFNLNFDNNVLKIPPHLQTKLAAYT